MNLGGASEVTQVRVARSPRARAWAATTLLAALVLASLASAVTVFGALVADDAGATPKLYHVGLMIGGAMLLVRGRIARPRPEMLLYFATTIAASLLAYTVLEPRVAGMKLLIALYVGVVAGGVGRVCSASVVLRACRVASVAFVVLVIGKNLQHIPAFVMFLASPSGHPDVPALAGGGLNIEATWLALSTIFLVGTALFIPAVLAAAATSALYGSRAGVAVAGIAVLAALAHAWGGRHIALDATDAARDRRRRMLTLAFAMTAAGLVTAGALAVREYGDATYVAQRFAAIGEEPGSVGRLTLWRGGLAVFSDYPLGVGVGNAVPVLERVLGIDVPEDNLHNIYLQHAVETGIPGLFALLVLCLTVARRVIAVRFRDHLLMFVAAYLVAGAIQFTGVDAMLWLAYGLQSGVSNGSADA
jgi:O-antigen ligase